MFLFVRQSVDYPDSRGIYDVLVVVLLGYVASCIFHVVSRKKEKRIRIW